jgi:predicted O-methyltransferase YrrM
MFNLDYDSQFADVYNACEGWCSWYKAMAMRKYITDRKLTKIVELGVWRGKSLLPMAATVKKRKEGLVIGIDPYSVSEAIQDYGEDLNERTKALDFEGAYQSVLKNIEKFELQDYCKLIRKTSTEAAADISMIDLLHIDANHSESHVLNDVNLYLPKVIPGGIIWFDDSDWAGVESTIKKTLEGGRVKILETLGSQTIMEKI